MLYLHLDHEDARIRNLGMWRVGCLRAVACALFLLGPLCWLARLYTSSYQIESSRVQATEEMALRKSVADLEERRAALRTHQRHEEARERAHTARWTVVAALNALEVVLPRDASLTEVALQGAALRLRGIAAHGRAIQVLIESLQQAFVPSQCVLESVRRAEDRRAGHYEFSIAVTFGASLRLNPTSDYQHHTAEQIQ
jgi:Tfp pilus assembly protein PilN